jgi:hypothetical protein
MLIAWLIGAVILMFVLVFSGTGWRLAHARRRARKRDQVIFAHLRVINRVTAITRAMLMVAGLLAAGLVAWLLPEHRGWFIAPSAWGLVSAIGIVTLDQLMLGRSPIAARRRPGLLRRLLPGRLIGLCALLIAAIAASCLWAWGQSMEDGRSHFFRWRLDGRFDWGVRRPFPGPFYSLPMMALVAVATALVIIGVVATMRRRIYRPHTRYEHIDFGLRRRTIHDLILVLTGVLSATLTIIGLNIAWAFATLGPGSSSSTIVVLLSGVGGVCTLVLTFWVIANLVFAQVVESDATRPRDAAHRLSMMPDDDLDTTADELIGGDEASATEVPEDLSATVTEEIRHAGVATWFGDQSTGDDQPGLAFESQATLDQQAAAPQFVAPEDDQVYIPLVPLPIAPVPAAPEAPALPVTPEPVTTPGETVAAGLAQDDDPAATEAPALASAATDTMEQPPTGQTQSTAGASRPSEETEIDSANRSADETNDDQLKSGEVAATGLATVSAAANASVRSWKTRYRQLGDRLRSGAQRLRSEASSHAASDQLVTETDATSMGDGDMTPPVISVDQSLLISLSDSPVAQDKAETENTPSDGKQTDSINEPSTDAPSTVEPPALAEVEDVDKSSNLDLDVEDSEVTAALDPLPADQSTVEPSIAIGSDEATIRLYGADQPTSLLESDLGWAPEHLPLPTPPQPLAVSFLYDMPEPSTDEAASAAIAAGPSASRQTAGGIIRPRIIPALPTPESDLITDQAIAPATASATTVEATPIPAGADDFELAETTAADDNETRSSAQPLQEGNPLINNSEQQPTPIPVPAAWLDSEDTPESKPTRPPVEMRPIIKARIIAAEPDTMPASAAQSSAGDETAVVVGAISSSVTTPNNSDTAPLASSQCSSVEMLDTAPATLARGPLTSVDSISDTLAATDLSFESADERPSANSHDQSDRDDDPALIADAKALADDTPADVDQLDTSPLGQDEPTLAIDDAGEEPTVELSVTSVGPAIIGLTDAHRQAVAPLGRPTIHPKIIWPEARIDLSAITSSRASTPSNQPAMTTAPDQTEPSMADAAETGASPLRPDAPAADSVSPGHDADNTDAAPSTIDVAAATMNDSAPTPEAIAGIHQNDLTSVDPSPDQTAADFSQAAPNAAASSPDQPDLKPADSSQPVTQRRFVPISRPRIIAARSYHATTIINEQGLITETPLRPTAAADSANNDAPTAKSADQPTSVAALQALGTAAKPASVESGRGSAAATPVNTGSVSASSNTGRRPFRRKK